MHIVDLSLKRPIFISMLLFSLLLFGFLSLKSMGVDLFPKIEFPVVTVVSVLPGADVKEVEKSTTCPIEDALSSISSIKNLRSKSMEGVSQIVIEFELEKSVDVAFEEVKAKLNSIRSALPLDLKEPVVEKFNIDSIPILSLVVSSEMKEETLTKFVEKQIKERLQKINQVGEIRLIGGREKKIWIEANPHLLSGYNATLQDVESTIKVGHFDLPGGILTSSMSQLPLKVESELSTPFDFGNLNIAKGGVRIRDVADVIEGINDEKSFSELNGKKVILLNISKQGGANSVDIADKLKNEIAKLEKELKAQGVNLDIAQDNSIYIRNSVDEVFFHLYLGGILAVLIVGIFLKNFRAIAIGSLALPLAVLGTFAVIHCLGFTLNIFTLLALSLAIGLLIDDSIVVQENIMRHIEEGATPQVAASLATREIAIAVFATTLSVVATFAPVAFMKGMIGRFFYQFGITVAVAVLISMAVSFTLTPLLASKIFKKNVKKGRIYCFLEGVFEAIKLGYVKVLKVAIRFKGVTLLLALIAFFAAMSSTKFLRFEFLTKEDQSEFNVRVQTEEGSSLDLTRSVVEEMRDVLQKEKWVKWTLCSVGNDVFQDATKGTIYVKMFDKKDRKISQSAAMEWAREHLKGKGEKNFQVELALKTSSGGFKAAEVQLEIMGPNLEKLQAVAEKIADKMKRIKGYTDIDLSYTKEGKPELNISINRDVAAQLNVSPIAIASTIRMAYGSDVGKFSRDGERYNVGVRLQDIFRHNKETIENLEVRALNGSLIPLKGVIALSDTKAPSAIDHCNRSRVVAIFANLDKKHKVLGEAMDELSKMLDAEKLPLGYSYNFSGMATNFKESFQNLNFALLLAIIIIYMVLVSQFESFLHPLIIMLSLPLATIGAITFLIMFKMTMSIMTMIAIIMLIGLVTKNGILLIDFINHLRKNKNLSLEEAVIQGSALRLRPILMTTFSIIFGMLPIACGMGAGAESHAPMATAIIGGLITSTFLTLLVVPAAYAFVEKTKGRLKNFILRKSS